MSREDQAYRRDLIAGALLALLVLLGLAFRDPLTAAARWLYDLLQDRDQTRAFMQASGPWAPVVFMAV